MNAQIVENKPVTIDEQKRIMLDILCAFDTYCKEHGLRYHLIGGTLIGSVRHKGFIPWDDDIDVGMPVEDYKKLLKMDQMNPIRDDLFLSSLENNSNHIWPMSKLFSKKTKLIEPNVLEKYQKMQESFGGVYIDIFPEYGLPDNGNDAKKLCSKMYRYYQSYKRASRNINPDGGFNALLHRLAFAPYRLIGIKHYLMKIRALSESYAFDGSKNYSLGFGIIKPGRDIFPTSIANEYIDGEFEGLFFPIPKGYDTFLSIQFGNYMELPPENQRKTHQRDVFYR